MEKGGRKHWWAVAGCTALVIVVSALGVRVLMSDEAADERYAFVEPAGHVPECVPLVPLAKRLDWHVLELLPDLSPLPPRDLRVERRGTARLLRFSTTYYNHGEGPLTLIADPATRGVVADIHRDVLQRVARRNGGYRDEVVGNFLWHNKHLHYHFDDFVTYSLTPVDVSAPSAEERHTKATFCVRDVSRVDVDNPHVAEDALFKICGKERQGVSVGWGDTYFDHYPDQSINVTGLPEGVYLLTFHVNPEQRFDEISAANNTSSAVFRMDPQTASVELLTVTPKDSPKMEHIYPEQPFGQ